MRNKKIIGYLISFILGVFIACFLFIQLNPMIGNKNHQRTTIYEKNSLAKSLDKIYNAVVVVEGYANDTKNNTGSGFIYKTDDKYGYIFTNEHVLSGSDTIKVTLYDDKVVDAKLLGKDEYLDLAILQIKKKEVPLVATIGSSEKVELGDTIFTVGTPIGYEYRGSVTSGVISGKDRMVSMSLNSGKDDDWVMKVLQIDASINPGNSGGPLLNINGEVIGIVSLKLVDDDIEGMGFAIPIEFAMKYTDALENGEEIKWPVIGIEMANIEDSAKLTRYHIETGNQKEGVVITSVQDHSAAKKAGLQVGDIIVKIGKEPIKDIAHLRYELYQYKKADTFEITYIRNGKEQKTQMTI